MAEEGAILWQASPDRQAATNLTGFLAWLAAGGRHFTGYSDLWQWSVDDLARFRAAIRDQFDLIWQGACLAVVSADPMPHTRWLVGTVLNDAEHVLRHECTGDPGRTMLHHGSERRPMASQSRADVAGAVRKLATRLRAIGIGNGDRLVAYLPNIPETVMAMLATTAIGAIWCLEPV